MDINSKEWNEMVEEAEREEIEYSLSKERNEMVEKAEREEME